MSFGNLKPSQKGVTKPEDKSSSRVQIGKRKTTGTTIPPAYAAISSKYEAVAKDADAILASPVRHTKSGALKMLQDTKAANDIAYEKAIGTTVEQKKDNKTGTQQDTLELEKQKVSDSKKLAEKRLEKASEKVEYSFSDRKNLEKYKGKMLVRVVQHAARMDKENKIAQEDIKEDPNASASEKQKIAQKQAAQKEVQQLQAARVAREEKKKALMDIWNTQKKHLPC